MEQSRLVKLASHRFQICVLRGVLSNPDPSPLTNICQTTSLTKMCTQKEIACKDCRMTGTQIKLCKSLKQNQDAKNGPYNLKLCPHLLVSDEVVGKYDRAHECRAL
jgi:hypothetical protein